MHFNTLCFAVKWIANNYVVRPHVTTEFIPNY